MHSKNTQNHMTAIWHREADLGLSLFIAHFLMQESKHSRENTTNHYMA